MDTNRSSCPNRRTRSGPTISGSRCAAITGRTAALTRGRMKAAHFYGWMRTAIGWELRRSQLRELRPGHLEQREGRFLRSKPGVPLEQSDCHEKGKFNSKIQALPASQDKSSLNARKK